MPKGVTINVGAGVVEVKWAKGSLKQRCRPHVKFELKGEELGGQPGERQQKKDGASSTASRGAWGQCREGVTNGFKRELDIVGVGYRAEFEGPAGDLCAGLFAPGDFRHPERDRPGVDKRRTSRGPAWNRQVGQVAATSAGCASRILKQKGVRSWAKC